MCTDEVAVNDLTNRGLILRRFVIRVKEELSSTFRIDKHPLAKMPAPMMTRREKWVVYEFLIYMTTSVTTAGDKWCEAANFIIILHNCKLRRFKDLEFRTSGLINIK